MFSFIRPDIVTLVGIIDYNKIPVTTKLCVTGVASKSPKFDATFGMQMLNGSAKHKHTINDFKLIGSPNKSSDGTVYNGTATVSLKKGPVNNVPVTIKITNSGDFSLKVDPKLTENHFGDTPIMGKVTA